MGPSRKGRRSAGRRGLPAVVLLLAACQGPSTERASPAWLAEDARERGVQLERQLRGLDVAMVETGYRYGELYWSGREANWDAAAYQARKLRLAMENGLERRPKRAASAGVFLEGPLTAIEEAVAARDAQLFAARFEALTVGCNTCHASEGVAFFEIRPPQVRLSPIR